MLICGASFPFFVVYAGATVLKGSFFSAPAELTFIRRHAPSRRDVSSFFEDVASFFASFFLDVARFFADKPTLTLWIIIITFVVSVRLYSNLGNNGKSLDSSTGLLARVKIGSGKLIHLVFPDS